MSTDLPMRPATDQPRVTEPDPPGYEPYREPLGGPEAPEPNPQERARVRAHVREGRLRSLALGTWVRGLLTGASAWTTPPPSLAQLWAHHVASARYYQAWVVRYPRYGWGALHVGIAAPAYLLVLATDSAWKVLGLALIAALVLWLV